ncbi:HD-GYP domain-containing protein [Streptomyces sp. NPDC059740]|uniref:HD-GYP domain-containing protein n=1 Tax=Streptomyces sp. NPDC059740 TaxID=3346926 RepID=UPI003655E223
MAGWSLLLTGLRGLHQPGTALAFAALIATGELIACTVRCPGAAAHPPPHADSPATAAPGRRLHAPMGAAVALGYAFLVEVGGAPTTHGVAQTVAVAGLGQLAGLAPRVATGRGPALDHLARRVVVTAFAAACCRPLGPPAEGRLPGLRLLLVLLAVALLCALCDAVLVSALARAHTGWSFGPLLRDDLRAVAGPGSAVCAAGVAIALGVAAGGLRALPLFCLPPLLVHLALHRHAVARATYRQTIASLARATEVAGLTPHGHARTVAALGRRVGRELGLPAADLEVLEHAALMHDIGQLSLLDPVPLGATATLPAADQRRIALLGGAVVRRTGVSPRVAVVVERQADPYRDQPLCARIVRTVNAYADLTAGGPAPDAGLRALERLRLATADEHDPRVVDALAAVLAHHRGTDRAVAGNRW